MRTLSALGLGVASGCATEIVPGERNDLPPVPVETIGPSDADRAAETNIRALLDVLIPTARDEAGRVTRPGAAEVEAFEAMRLATFLPAARRLGLVPELPGAVLGVAEGFDVALRAVIDADLDALAATERPLTRFANLPSDLQRQVVARAFAQPERAPWLPFVRAVGFIAYLGAIRSDAGLRALGFPAFEDREAGVAVRGYPRTIDGRLVDASTEDLGALARMGVLDDYTYNVAPEPTPGDDLSAIVDANGDLY